LTESKQATECEIKYREDGVTFRAAGGKITVLVWPRGESNVGIRLWDDQEVATDPEVGDIERRAFRIKLQKLAEETFADTEGLRPTLSYVSQTYREHLAAREEQVRKAHDEEEPEGLAEASYGIKGGGFTRKRYVGGAETTDQLTNFLAKITRDVTHDDGAEKKRQFEISATLLGMKHVFEVSAAQFAAMSWVHERLGASAVVFPGYTTKDHARTAIQLYSGEPKKEIVYGHTGWRKIHNEWVYLFAGGAIGSLTGRVFGPAWSESESDPPQDPTTDDPHNNAEESPNGRVGRVLNIRTDPLGELSCFRELPEPPGEEDLKRAIRASIGILDLADDEMTILLHAGVYRAALGESDFSIHIEGATGEGKSELAATMQQHFAPEIDARRLMSWEATENALEIQAFALKDQVMVIDDYNPVGSSYDVQRWNKKADRVLRAKGNHAGRQRLRSDLSMRPSRPPRALIISTGEETPGGQSLRARLLVLELKRGGLDFDVLTRCQNEGRQGLYAAAMSGFVAFLAPHYEEVRKSLKALREKFRKVFIAGGYHRRTVSLIADLALGWHSFLIYALKSEALTEREAKVLWRRGLRALKTTEDKQASHQAASDPVERFAELLGAAITGGQAHLSGTDFSKKYIPPGNPYGWGWHCTGNDKGEEWVSQGIRIGFLASDGIYLDPDAALKVAREMGRDSSESISVAKTTLNKRLKERGKLLSTDLDTKRGTITVRRSFLGRRAKYLHVDPLYLSPHTEKSDQSDHNGQDPLPYAEPTWSDIEFDPTNWPKNPATDAQEPNQGSGRSET
jgi:hypothetical protein